MTSHRIEERLDAEVHEQARSRGARGLEQVEGLLVATQPQQHVGRQVGTRGRRADGLELQPGLACATGPGQDVSEHARDHRAAA